MFFKKQLNSLNLKHNLYPIIIWLIPVFIAFIAQIFSFGINRVLFKNALENTATAIVFVSFTLIFRHKASHVLQHILFYIFVFTNLFESVYFSIFKANISASSIFIILETNFAEATEFVDFYLNPSLILIGLFFILIAFFYAIKPAYFEIKSVFRYQKIIFILGVVLPIMVMNVRDYMQFNFIYLSVKSVREYITEHRQMERFNIDQPTTDIKGFVQEKEIDEATFVMIIGESTTRNRMSLYGYEKETTPYLDEIQSEIYRFDDVITSYAYTIGALKDALTLHNLESTDDFSIVQLMNEAGFKTFWLSNQRPIGEYESLVTKIAMASDVYTPKNTALDGSITPYDAVLIPELEKALKDPAKKKFIVLHPLGTHMQYSDRYPSSFEHFKAEGSNSKFDHELSRHRSSSYDNAVLYHDFFIQSIHEKLTQLQEASFMLYFSDHGDEVYETINFAGHLDDQPTPDMYEIPFILWTNQAYQNYNPMENHTERSAVLRGFIHSLSDLIQVEFDDYDPKRSLFSDEFQAEDRIIGNGINYDKELKR